MCSKRYSSLNEAKDTLWVTVAAKSVGQKFVTSVTDPRLVKSVPPLTFATARNSQSLESLNQAKKMKHAIYECAVIRILRASFEV